MPAGSVTSYPSPTNFAAGSAAATGSRPAVSVHGTDDTSNQFGRGVPGIPVIFKVETMALSVELVIRKESDRNSFFKASIVIFAFDFVGISRIFSRS
jgi:hypothetical protein